MILSETDVSVFFLTIEGGWTTKDGTFGSRIKVFRTLSEANAVRKVIAATQSGLGFGARVLTARSAGVE